MKSSSLCKAIEYRINNYLDQSRKAHTDSSPDVIHDYRVAARYLLTIEPLLRSASDTSKWRKKLKKELKSLNYIRDIHVYMLRFSESPNIMTLLETEAQQELSNWKTARKNGIDDGFIKKLRGSHQQLCSVQHKKTVIEALVYGLWLQRCTILGKRLHTVDYKDTKSIHRLRIAFKAYRYYASFLHDAELVPFSSFDQFKYWQDIMGNINDLKMAAHWLSGNPGHEKRVHLLNADATALMEKLRLAEPVFKAFIDTVNEDVFAGLGIRIRRCAETE